MKSYIDIAREVAPDINPLRVLGVADARHRYLAEMTHSDWMICADIARANPPLTEFTGSLGGMG